MANLTGLASVVSALRVERTNLVNRLRHVDAALSVLGKPGGAKQRHLLAALQATHIDQLRRKCDLQSDGRKAACALFWTLGSNQVGKGEIIGWRDVIVPGLRGSGGVALWPFDGCLDDLLRPGNVVIVETYPAECYRWFFKNGLKGKGKTEVRKQAASALLNWAKSANVTLDPKLQGVMGRAFRMARTMPSMRP